MSVGYRAISWNRQKRLYDGLVGAAIALHLALFVGASAWLHPEATLETLLIRAFGTGAFALLHVVLCIGPLARLDARFLPLLYNRRHLGVATCLLALAHGGFALVQFHALGSLNPFVSLFAWAPGYGGIAALPFQPLGAVALAILVLMAATSHDFWLAALSAPRWKALHMLVYPAFALVELHVVLGVLQAETSPWLVVLLVLGLVAVLGLHAAAALRGAPLDRARDGEADGTGWIDVCALDELREGRARIVTLAGERVALFRWRDRRDGREKLSALSNVCQHQNGPLGEGRVVDGLVTCPWHGYQYRPDCGRSPEPFQERVPTFRVRIAHGRAQLDPRPLPAGSFVEPALVPQAARNEAALGAPPSRGEAALAPEHAASADEGARALYVGYLPRMPAGLVRFLRPRLALGFASLALVSLTLAAAQRDFGPGTFEYGHPRTFAGRLALVPHPVLVVAAPGAAQGARASWLVVGQGKHGADAELAPLAGRRVRLEATPIHREGRTLLELVPGSARLDGEADAGASAGASGALGPAEELGEHAFVGEIVDSKCFLGVMKPGALKPHRACAMRCIAGGIPPLLIVRTRGGPCLQLLLVGTQGEAIGERVLGRVAEPVLVRGRLQRLGELLVLRTDPATFADPP